MSHVLILVAAATLGIEVGWEPLADGGHVYTVQIEPDMLDVLKRGKDEIFSEVPPDIDVRRFQFVVGTGKLARIGGPRRSDPARVGEDASPPQEPNDDRAAPPIRLVPDETAEPSPKYDEPAGAAGTPLRLRDSSPPASDLKNANYDAPRQTVEAERPALTQDPAGAALEPTRPWIAFVIALVILCCSLGANVYLGWTAWDARSRYRGMLEKLRAAPAS